jgi:peptidoglycan-associated lipoprotein
VSLGPIYFDFDKSFIREDAKPALQKVADYMKTNKDAKIQVQGNCDERGTSEYNMALGDRRATSAKKYLAGLGVDAKRITTASFGKEKPICTEHNEECWQKNRRGDFVLQK